MNSYETDVVTAHFERLEDAERAVNVLRENNTPDADISLHSSDHAGGGFFDGVKRFFSGEEGAQYSTGAIVTVVGAPQSVEVLRRFGGRVADDGTGSRTAVQSRGSDAVVGASDEEQRVRLHEERLSVNKATQRAGEVRLRKEVVTENQTIDVPVSHEEVYIERRSAQPGTSLDDAEFERDDEVRIPVMREEVTVETHPVATEEVAIGKRSVQGTQTVTGAVRKERARVETDGDVNVAEDAARRI